jgi:hypothetical protein
MLSQEQQENLWEVASAIEKNSGPVSAFLFVLIFGFIKLGIWFLAAWAISATFGSGYWMTLLCIISLKFALD